MLFVNLSTTTVGKYLDVFEKVFVIFQVPVFGYKVKDQLQHPKKIYCVDPGLRNAISFRFSEDFGKLYENLVFIELKRRLSKNPLAEIYYWKDQQHREVDFVIKEGLKPKELIQVCYNIDDEETKKRELKGLIKAMDEFKLRSSLVITEYSEGEEKIENKKIKFLPLWKWLLS